MNSPMIPEAIRRAAQAPVASAVAIAVAGAFPGDTTSNRVIELMPSTLRIQSIDRAPNPGGGIVNRATLYHRRATIRVDWITQHVDTRLHRYGLATIQHAQTVRSTNGVIRIDRLLPADRPLAHVNLFEMVLPEWIKDRNLVRRAAALWAELPRPLAHLVNATLWDGRRFERFVTGPASLHGQHRGRNGNFRHSVEVAEMTRDLGRKSLGANIPLLIAAGLLHDAGKADTYRYDRYGHGFRLSDRGARIGHRPTLIEWLALARECGRVILPDDLYLALLQMIHTLWGMPAGVRLGGAPGGSPGSAGGQHPDSDRRAGVTGEEVQ